MKTTPTLALPLRGRECSFTVKHRDFSFPLRGKVGMGVVEKFFVVSVTFVFTVADFCPGF
jgi:hypothetical protein